MNFSPDFGMACTSLMPGMSIFSMIKCESYPEKLCANIFRKGFSCRFKLHVLCAAPVNKKTKCSWCKDNCRKKILEIKCFYQWNEMWHDHDHVFYRPLSEIPFHRCSMSSLLRIFSNEIWRKYFSHIAKEGFIIKKWKKYYLSLCVVCHLNIAWSIVSDRLF